MDKNQKTALIKKHSPRSTVFKNSAFAFIFGGGICLFGEMLLRLYISLGIDPERATSLVSVSLIFLAGGLTALGIFDSLARVAGAGTLVPVTGFANAVVSEALDARSEGFVLGVGSKIFTVAGPVILYGLFGGAVYGLIYYLFSFLGGVI